MSDWYNETGAPATSSQGSSSTMRNEFSAISTAMDKLPALTGNGSKVIAVNAGGTALEALTAANARTNIGLGTIATQNSNAVAITGGDATGLTNLSTTNFSIGGTAVTSPAEKINYTDITTPGTAQASKALVLNSNSAITSGLGDIAVGGTARAWNSAFAVIDIGAGAAIQENTANRNVTVAANHYIDSGAVARYANNGFAVGAYLRPSDGAFSIATAPSGTAGNAAALTDRFAVAVDGTTTINGNVARHYGNTPTGMVNASGTALNLPAGWSSVKSGTGFYTITNNLGTTLYTPTATLMLGSAAGMIRVDILNSTTFRVYTFNGVGTPTDSNFSFAISLW